MAKTAQMTTADVNVVNKPLDSMHPTLALMWLVRKCVVVLRRALPDTKNLTNYAWIFIGLATRANRVNWVKVQQCLDTIRDEINDDKLADRIIRLGLGKEARDLVKLGTAGNAVIDKAYELRASQNPGGFQFPGNDSKIYANMSGTTLVEMLTNPNSANDLVLLA